MGNRRGYVCPDCRRGDYWREMTYTEFIEHRFWSHDEAPSKELIQRARDLYQSLAT